FPVAAAGRAGHGGGVAAGVGLAGWFTGDSGRSGARSVARSTAIGLAVRSQQWLADPARFCLALHYAAGAGYAVAGAAPRYHPGAVGRLADYRRGAAGVNAVAVVVYRRSGVKRRCDGRWQCVVAGDAGRTAWAD